MLEEAKLDLNEKILEKNVEKIKALSANLKEKIDVLKREHKKPLEDAEVFERLINEHETQVKELPQNLDKLNNRLANLEAFKQNLSHAVYETENANELLFLNRTIVFFNRTDSSEAF